MKKFFDKIRRWLIKKLGGYTEQFPPLAPVEVKTYTRPIEKLCWECRIPADGYIGMDHPQQMTMLHEIDTVAMKKLTEEIFNRGFVNVQTEYPNACDPLSDRRRRYTILVARP